MTSIFPKTVRFHSLAFRYSLFFLVSIVLIFSFAFIYGYRYSKALLVDGAEKEATLLTQQTIARLENVINPAEVLPGTLADAMETQKIGFDQVISIARTFVSSDPAVFGSCLALEPNSNQKDQRWCATYLFEKDHQITERNLGNEAYDYFSMDWYRLPKLLNRPVWTEPYFDKGGGEVLMCTYSTPFYTRKNGTRQFGGVITMDISLLALEQMVKQIKLFKTGYGFLVSAGGMVISSPKLVLENKNVLEIGRIGRGKQTQMALKAMIDGKSGFTAMDGLDAQVHPSFLAYAPLSSTGWSLGIIFPEEDLMDDLYSFFRKILWIVACSLLALLVTTVLITRSLTRPIIHLVDATRQIGQGDFHSQLPVRKTKDEIMQLTSAFAVMQEELGNYIRTLQRTTIAKEKIESELQVAHNIQMGMLPRGFLTPGNWELYATLDPAKAVGGDLYDFFYPDPDHLCIAIGDVSGKGVPAALFMMVTRTLFRAKAVAGSPLSVVMDSINRELCQDNPSQMFVTFFAGIVNLGNGEMVFCNAGHNYPYILDPAGNVRQLKFKGGLPLGVSGDLEYQTGSFFFSPGEIMVLTTDGITDALNVTDDFFGETNLTDALTARAGSSPRRLADSLLNEVKLFADGTEQADDITILALQYKEISTMNGSPVQPVHLTLRNSLAELEAIKDSLDQLAGWNIPRKIIMEVNLVLEELFTNVVFYSFDDQKEHLIRMDFTLPDASQLQIRIEDDGKAFNLLERKISDLYGISLDEREVGGLGIHFVREIMTNVVYQRLDGKNVVILTKIF